MSNWKQFFNNYTLNTKIFTNNTNLTNFIKKLANSEINLHRLYKIETSQIFWSTVNFITKACQLLFT